TRRPNARPCSTTLPLVSTDSPSNGRTPVTTLRVTLSVEPPGPDGHRHRASGWFGCGQPVGGEFDAEASTLKPLFRQDRFEIVGRIGAFSVVPDANVRDGGRAPCLLHIRTSGEQRDDVIPSREHGTLEEDVAVGAEAGEVIVAFLCKEEQRIEPALDEQTPCLRQALCGLLTAKVEVGLHHACLPQWRRPATASHLSARPRGQGQL